MNDDSDAQSPDQAQDLLVARRSNVIFRELGSSELATESCLEISIAPRIYGNSGCVIEDIANFPNVTRIHIESVVAHRIDVIMLLSMLPKLTDLTIVRCGLAHFSGSPYEDSLHKAGKTLALERLTISNSHLDFELSGFFCDVAKSLKRLSLIGCTLMKGLPENIGCLSALEQLEVIECPLVQIIPKSVEELGNLQNLVIINCPVYDFLPVLDNLDSLAVLDLSGCGMLTYPRHWKPRFDIIKCISISSCYRLNTENILGEISKSTSLKLVMCDIFQAEQNPALFSEIIKDAKTVEFCRERPSYVQKSEIVDSAGDNKTVLLYGQRADPAVLSTAISYAQNITVVKFVNINTFSRFPTVMLKLGTLQQISVVGCLAFVDLSEDIRMLSNLKVLELVGCLMLRSVPVCIGDMALERLEISSTCLDFSIDISELMQASLLELKLHTRSIQRISALERCTRLVCMDLGRNMINAYNSVAQWNPETLGRIQSLKKLRVYKLNTSVMISFPGSLASRITELHILESFWLAHFPGVFDRLSELEDLRIIRCASFVDFPDSIKCLSKLKTLKVENCQQFVGFPESVTNVTTLEILSANVCPMVRSMPLQIGNMHNLKTVEFFGCSAPTFTEIPYSIGNLSKLESLDVSLCRNLSLMPESIGRLVNIDSFSFVRCQKLKRLPFAFADLYNQAKYGRLIYAGSEHNFPPTNIVGRSANRIAEALYYNNHPLKILLIHMVDRRRVRMNPLSRNRRLPREIWDLIYAEFLENCEYVHIIDTKRQRFDDDDDDLYNFI